MKNALTTNKSKWGKEGLWGLDSKEWLDELSKEKSLEQEYIVSVIDSYLYYGMRIEAREVCGVYMFLKLGLS